MLVHHLARDIADILVADAGVVRPLRRRVAAGREAERTAVLVEEIFLLEAEPRAFIVENGGALVRCVWRHTVRHHHFAHHQRTIGAGAVRVDRDRLQHAIRTVTLGLQGRASVEAPQRKLFQGRKFIELLDLRFAAQIRHRGISVEPDILELILCH